MRWLQKNKGREIKKTLTTIKRISFTEEAEGIKFDGLNYHEIEKFLDKAGGWITNINDSTTGKLDKIIVSYSDDGMILDIPCFIGDMVAITQRYDIRIVKKEAK